MVFKKVIQWILQSAISEQVIRQEKANCRRVVQEIQAEEGVLEQLSAAEPEGPTAEMYRYISAEMDSFHEKVRFLWLGFVDWCVAVPAPLWDESLMRRDCEPFASTKAWQLDGGDDL